MSYRLSCKVYLGQKCKLYVHWDHKYLGEDYHGTHGIVGEKAVQIIFISIIVLRRG